MSIVSENIRYLRNRNDLTQEQLARRLGTKRPNIGAYEEGRANPPRETLIKLSQLFGVTIDQILTVDLRRIRETPSLNLGMSQSPPAYRQERPPQPVQKVVDTYFRDKSEINLVAQRVTLRKLSKLDFALATERVSAPPVPAPTPVSTPRPPEMKPVSVQESGGIRVVTKDLTKEYLTKHKDPGFLLKLPPFQGLMQKSGIFRGFEVGSDFSMPGATLIAELVTDWYKLEDSKQYIIVSATHGVLYRRVYNQLSIKNTLLLSSDVAGVQILELTAKDILEVWSVKGYYSTQLPEPSLPIGRLKALLEEMNAELERFKKPN